jgi:hypothetical protein
MKTKKEVYAALEGLFTRLGHVRSHPWPDARDVEYVRYAAAFRRADWCYWTPWGWMPWAEYVIRYYYRKRVSS